MNKEDGKDAGRNWRNIDHNMTVPTVAYLQYRFIA